MMSGSSTTVTEPKKKKKLTKAEKAQAKLEKAADDLRRSGAKFEYFLDRMEIWLKKHNRKLLDLCKALDMENEGAITYDEFKSCLFDLGSPCNKVETQLLCNLLDPTEQEAIEYIALKEGFKYIRDRELSYSEKDIKPAIVQTQRSFEKCSTCKLSIWDGNTDPHQKRYVQLELRLVTFDGTREHPAHLQLLTHSTATIKSVMDHIRQQTALLSTKLAIFRDKSRRMEAMLMPQSTLEDLGIKGGPAHEPEQELLYYDYVVEFTDCPLLMCDHYF